MGRQLCFAFVYKKKCTRRQLAARADTNQFRENVHKYPGKKSKGAAFTEATAGGTEATSALRSPTLLSRAPTLRSPPATPLVSLEAEALIARGHLALPRNGRGPGRKRKWRETATEAGAIVALAWMEGPGLGESKCPKARGKRWSDGEGGRWPWLELFTSLSDSERHTSGRSGEGGSKKAHRPPSTPMGLEDVWRPVCLRFHVREGESNGFTSRSRYCSVDPCFSCFMFECELGGHYLAIVRRGSIAGNKRRN